MRVIAGDFRGRQLQAVPGKGTRPTTDKVKESIFSMIGPFFDGGWVLDLYAGTGGLGIEALSRGCERAVFVDADQRALSIVRQNIAQLGLEARCETYRNDAGRALKALGKRDVQFDLVFLDPPYAYQKLAAEITAISEQHLLSAGGRIVAEHDAAIELPEQIGTYIREKTATYGDTTISIFQ